MKKLIKVLTVISVIFTMMLPIATNTLAKEGPRKTYTIDGTIYMNDANLIGKDMETYGNAYIFYDEDKMLYCVAVNRYSDYLLFEHIYYPDENNELIYDDNGDEYKIVTKYETYYKFYGETYTVKTDFPITYYYENDELYKMKTPFWEDSPSPDMGFPMNYTSIAKRLVSLALYGMYDNGRLVTDTVEIMPTMTEGEKAWDGALSRYGYTIWGDWLEYCSSIKMVGNESCSWTPMDTFMYELNDRVENDIKIIKTRYNIESEGSENFTGMPNHSGYMGLRNPKNALKMAKGTFYQDYVYEYWKRTNQLYYNEYGKTIPDVENFFKQEGLTLYDGSTPSVTTTPTPADRVAKKLDSIKRKQNVENTLYVFNINGVLTLAVNGEIVSFPDLQPFYYEDRTQIPVRAVAEMLDCEVNWDSRIRTAIINGNGKLITITIDSPVITVNGADTVMDTTPIIKDGRTCVPIRHIAEALGLTVNYEEM